jgi:EmrB/QacA subfamily drug resistance transporter
MDRSTKIIIATLSVPAFMIGTDFTGALMLVIPIEHEFSSDITTTQWVLNVYALTVAMALVAGGRLGDMFGRRRVLLIGLVIFFASALVCTFAPTIAWLIGARAVQGVGAALVWPCVLAIVMTSVEEEERGTVMALTIGAVSVGNVVAPFFAGIVAGLGEWRLFFFVNVVLAGLSTVLVWRFLAKDTIERRDERVDYGGMIVLSLAIFALLYGLDVGADWGWSSTRVIALFLLSVALIVAFPLVEKRLAQPMVPPPMMRNRPFLRALAANGLVSPAIFLLFLYMPQYLHEVLDWSVLWAAMGTLPLLVSLCIFNLTAGRFYTSIGPRWLLTAGHALTVVGAIWITILSPSWGYLGVVPPMVLIGVGCGLIFGPAGTAAVNAADPSRAGLAGGLSFMFHLGLGAIGVGGATALMFAASQRSFAEGLERIGVSMSAADQLALSGGEVHTQAAQQALARYGPEVVAKITPLAGEAFTDGLHLAYSLALAFAVVGLIFSLGLDESKLRGVDREEADG